MGDFYMGCDVSKGYADFIVINKSKRVIEKPFQIDDTFEGHSALTNILKQFFVRNSKAKLYAAVESTGGYEDNWYSLLLRLGEIHPVKVTRLNPLGVKKHHEASMKRNITDNISAENIASYLLSYPENIVYGQDTNYNRLCRQWNCTQLLVKQQGQLMNQLNSLMYQSHPGLLRYCKQGVPDWVLDVMSRYPTAKRLARVRPLTLARIPFVTIEKAKCITSEAKKSVAAHIGETDEFMIKQIVMQIKNLDLSIKAHKQHLEKNCTLSEIDLLCTFKGISWYSAVGLLINIISISRFPTVKHLVSYFGLHPVYKQSGDGVWGYHMSKRGRKQPRAILFMVALSAINYNPVIKQLYEDCLEKGMQKLAAIGVCMHKILRIVYGMLKSNKSFDARIDELNRNKKVIKCKKVKKDNRRRFQTHDKAAPITRRQTKKRNNKGENREPQKKVVLMNGVIPNLPMVKSKICYEKNQKEVLPEKIGEIIMKAICKNTF